MRTFKKRGFRSKRRSHNQSKRGYKKVKKYYTIARGGIRL